MRPYDRVYAEINLDAVKHNMASMKQNLSDQTAIYGVVKADGYGHGAVPVARAIDEYVRGFAVATIWEAVNLRRHGIAKPILVLGYTYEDTCSEYVRYDIRPTVFSLACAKLLSKAAAELNARVKIHIKVDTGMGRIGFSPDEASLAALIQISRLPGIEIEGIFTHFAKADEKEKEAANGQLKQFCDFMDRIKAAGLEIPIRHCSNSAALIDMKEANLDAVRAGISIYGLYPSPAVLRSAVSLQPVMSLKSQVVMVKEVGAGTPLSYGWTYVTKGKAKIATIPVGYGDGYPRNLSNRGAVLIRGQRAPILGRVCMDQMMVDVSRIPEVKAGDVVTLAGTDGPECITIEELAELAGTFHYEFVCNVGKRIPRVYLENGKITGTKDYFNDPY